MPKALRAQDTIVAATQLIGTGRKDDMFSGFKNERKCKMGEWQAELAGAFLLCSLIATGLSCPAFAGDDTVMVESEKNIVYTHGSIFPALQRIASFNEPDSKDMYDKDIVRIMRRAASFLKRNSGNRAFELIAEAVMHELLNV